MSASSFGFVATILFKFIYGLIDRWLLSEKQKESGRAEERRKQQEAVDDAVEIWDSIDASHLDLADALDSLRKRSSRTKGEGDTS